MKKIQGLQALHGACIIFTLNIMTKISVQTIMTLNLWTKWFNPVVGALLPIILRMVMVSVYYWDFVSLLCPCQPLSQIEMVMIFNNHQRDAVRLFPRVFIFGLFPFNLEERQRARKRSWEEKGHNFMPRWFDLTEEMTPTPWGDLEIYQREKSSWFLFL